jgi:hypothetical protein
MVYLYKWKDVDFDGLINGNELSIVAVGSKTSTNFLTTDSSGKTFTVPLINPKSKLIPRLENNTWYYLAAGVSTNFRIGADGNTNYGMRSRLSIHVDSNVNSFPEFWAPMDNSDILPPYSVFSDTLFMLPLFAKNVTSADRAVFENMNGLTPAMALHISKQVPTAITDPTAVDVFNKFELYPNPTVNKVSVNVELKNKSNMIVSVVNALGRTMLYYERKDFTSGKIDVNTSEYPSGNYYFVLGTGDGAQLKEFTVIH